VAFSQTLKVGNFAEQFIQRLFSQASIPTTLNKNKSKLIEWDIEAELSSQRFRVECKFDVMASKTGNLAIEYYNTKLAKPSGIAATTADLWAVVLQNPLEAYIANTSVLRAYCQKVAPYRSITNGGDQNAALWLYPKDQILPAVFTRVDDLHPAELADVLLRLLTKNSI